MSDMIKVYLDNAATTVEEALEFLSDKAIELGIADDRQAVLDAFKAREALGTTGMMGGFAMPHCKSAVVKDVAIVVVKFAGNVEWDALDGKPIEYAIALFSPDGDTHLALLSSVAQLLVDESFRGKVRAATDADSLAAIFDTALAAL